MPSAQSNTSSLLLISNNTSENSICVNLPLQFWHVQHEFVEAEKAILGRSDNKVTSRAGYAGGNLGMKDGKVYVVIVHP